jgi:hypothetical protein
MSGYNGLPPGPRGPWRVVSGPFAIVIFRQDSGRNNEISAHWRCEMANRVPGGEDNGLYLYDPNSFARLTKRRNSSSETVSGTLWSLEMM